MKPFDLVVTGLVRGALFVSRLLPARIVLPLTRALGTTTWLVARRRRRIIRRNLDIAFHDRKTPRQKSRLAHLAFQHAARCAAGLALQERWLDKAYLERFIISPEDDAVLEAGPKTGTAVLSGHVGHWEMGQLYFYLRDFPLVVFARELSNPYLNASLRASRSKRGGSISSRAAGELRQALREGKNVGIVADQNDRRRRYYPPFFGFPAASYIGYARILLRARCRILFIACLEESSSKWRFRFLARELRPAGDPARRWTRSELDTESKRLVRDYLRATEEVARAYPEQYFWLHRRWKSRPWDSPKLYDNLGRPLDPAVLEEARLACERAAAAS